MDRPSRPRASSFCDRRIDISCCRPGRCPSVPRNGLPSSILGRRRDRWGTSGCESRKDTSARYNARHEERTIGLWRNKETIVNLLSLSLSFCQKLWPRNIGIDRRESRFGTSEPHFDRIGTPVGLSSVVAREVVTLEPRYKQSTFQRLHQRSRARATVGCAPLRVLEFFASSDREDQEIPRDSFRQVHDRDFSFYSFRRASPPCRPRRLIYVRPAMIDTLA